jgi:hypothetical protein
MANCLCDARRRLVSIEHGELDASGLHAAPLHPFFDRELGIYWAIVGARLTGAFAAREASPSQSGSQAVERVGAVRAVVRPRPIICARTAACSPPTSAASIARATAAPPGSRVRAACPLWKNPGRERQT